MVDIIFFDYWTRGIRHFTKLNEGLRKNGLTSLMLHLGSRRGENQTPEEIIDGVLCRDIKFYRDSIVKALTDEKPKLVLLLNNQTEDKIIVRAARALGIKTVFLMHGVRGGGDDLNSLSAQIDSAFGLKVRLKRIPKYTRLYLQYLNAARLQSISSMFDSEIHLFFLRIMMSPGKTFINVWRYRDSVADLAFVYSDDDKELFIETFGYPSESVKVVGNYNLDMLHSYFMEHTETASIEDKEPTDVDAKKGVFLYIENGFSDPKYPMPGWTEELVSDEIVKIAELLRQYNFDLHVKLHPSSDYSTLIEKLADIENVKIFNRCDLARLVLESDVVLGQNSSVLMMALAVNKPILLLSIPPLEIRFTQYLDKNAGTLVCSMADLEQYVQNFYQKDREAILMNRDSRDRFVGPFDGKCSERIVHEICRAVQ